jgi:plastocyanin
MCRIKLWNLLLFSLLQVCLSIASFAQSPGFIVRPAAGPGPLVLNPNSDSWTSVTNAGFTSSDISQSEIGYKVIKPLFYSEPTGDLATGPNGGYSDIVKTVDGSGCYLFYDGTNLLFRIRIGSIVSGAKAYNMLFDTDMKIGATGVGADPNYVTPTNSGNGNPGFEWEVALETGSSGRVAVYNVDGIVNPTVTNTYSLATNHLISAALSRESNNADYFYDFYIPAAALGITATTPFRIVVTTNTNPGSAFQGTRSDIYGIDDTQFPNTTDAWEYVAKNTASFSLNDISSSGPGAGDPCTAAPTVSSGIGAGTSVSVGGSWTKLSGSTVSTATITVYKNGVSQGTTSCTSGSAWNLTIPSISTGDVITAKAQGAGESMCLESNSVAALGCTPANITSTGSASYGICVNDRRGIAGTKLTNATVRIYQATYNAIPSLYATDGTPTSPSTFLVTYGSPSNVANTTWEYNGSNNSGSIDPCSGGPNDIPNGSYYITVTESGKCESAPIWGSCVNQTSTATPTITQTVLYPGSQTISGNSTEANPTTIRLFINGFLITSQNVAASAAYSFSNVIVQTGDVITIRAQAASKCISAAASLTASCFTTVPQMTTDIQGSLTAGATTVSGTSNSPAGTTIRVYLSPATEIGNTTVLANGSWSASVTPALVAGSNYYTTAKNGTCAVSSNSATATARAITTLCPVISGSYMEGDGTVSGTLPSSFTGTIYLYQDGSQIGSVSVTSATTWNITVSPSNPLYTGGVLTVGAQATSGTLNRSCASTTTISCSAPTAPAVSPTSTTIASGQTVTYTITGSQSNVLYSIQNATSGASYAASQFGNGGTLNFTSLPFSTPGTYNVSVIADKLSGSTCINNAAATIIVSNPLPVTWLSFTARKQGNGTLLQWVTGSEVNSRDFQIEHSMDGSHWNRIGSVPAATFSSSNRSYQYIHAVASRGINYYRLVQRDLDGWEQYSRVLSLAHDAIMPLTIFPNPVTDGSVILQVPVAQLFFLYDAAGRELFRKYLREGSHWISLEGLSAGVYLLRYGAETKKLMIRN